MNKFFSVWYHYKSKSSKGGISLYNVHFGNFWIIGEDWGNNAGKLTFNREGLAIDLGCPEIPPKDSLNEIISILTEWAEANKEKIDLSFMKDNLERCVKRV